MAANHESSNLPPPNESVPQTYDTLSTTSLLAICNTQQQYITSLQHELREEQTRRLQAETKILDQLSNLHTLTQGLRSRIALLDAVSSDAPADSVSTDKRANVAIATTSNPEKANQKQSEETQRLAAPPSTLTILEAHSKFPDPESTRKPEDTSYHEAELSVAGPISPDDVLSRPVQLEDARDILDSGVEYEDQTTNSNQIPLANTFNRSSTITRSQKSSESQSPGPESTDTPDTDISSLSDEDSAVSSDTDIESVGEYYDQTATRDEPTSEPAAEEETTVEVSAPSQSASTKRTVRWSPAEDECLRSILKRLLKKKITDKAAFDQAAVLMKAKGYLRTPHAITLRWYKKLVKKCSTQAGDTPKEPNRRTILLKVSTPDESAAPASKRQKRASQHQKKEQSAQPTAPLAENEVPEPGFVSAERSARRHPSDSLLSVRLGSGRQTINTARSAALALQEDVGRQFIIDKTWTGASNDIIDVAWSPDSTKYIAGSAAIDDPLYNRPNNLLLGDLVNNQLHNLPGHRLSHAQSTTQSTFLDPWMYSTVSSVAWSGDWMYTAGFDCTVKVWDAQEVSNSVYTMPHESKVEVMAVAKSSLNLLATGTDLGDESLRLYHNVTDGGHGSRIELPLIRGKPTFTYSPTCIKFGIVPNYANHLLAGFGSNTILEDGSPSPRGFLGLWRCDEARISRIPLDPAGQQVFDVAWSEQSNVFISGSTIGRRRGGIGGSLLRVYDGGRTDNVLEAYCPALDMSEVSICPFDERVLSAACTDGNTYVWDTRNLDTPLHVLSHGPNVSGHHTELSDTGIRVLQWGRHRRELFTGGSDGVLNQWDISQATTDALTEEIVSSGIELMCGKLSPDKNSFFLGDASGSLQILSRSPMRATEHPEEIDFVYAERVSTSTSIEEPNADTEGWGGRAAAQELLETGQIALYPEGIVGQGPNYAGPFAAWARAPTILDEDLKDVPLLPEYRLVQFEASKKGVKRKHSEIDPSRQSRIISLKMKKRDINLAVPTGTRVDQKACDPQDRSSDPVADEGLSAVTLLQHTQDYDGASRVRQPAVTRESDSGDHHHDGDKYNIDDSDSDDDDDGYIPPHWMVDANLTRTVAD